MTSPAPVKSPSRFLLFLVIAAAIHLASAGWHIFFGAINPDEGFYAVATRAVAHGEVPYRDFGFTQPPLVLYANCLPLRLIGFGLFAQRALNGLWSALAVLLAALWVGRSTRFSWGMALALAFSLSSPWMYFTHLGKTYAWTALVVTGTAWVFLNEAPGIRRAFLLGTLAALGVSSRLPAAPFFATLIFFGVWSEGAIKLRMLVAAILGVMLGAIPLLACWVAAPAEMQFWMLDFHRLSVPNKLWHLAAPEILTLAPALWALLVIAAFAIARNRLWRSREAAVLLAAVAGLAANLLPGGVYEEYGTPFLPALAMAAAVLLYRAAPNEWSFSRQAFLAGALAVVQLTTAPLLFWRVLPERRATVNWWLPYNAPAYDQALPTKIAQARDAVTENLPPGAPFLGPNLILAAETNRYVPPELRMGPFSLTTEMSAAEAARLHLATPATINRWLDRRDVNVWSLFERPSLNYSWSMPSFGSLPQEVRGPWVEKWGHDFKVAWRGGEFVVLVRRSGKDGPVMP